MLETRDLCRSFGDAVAVNKANLRVTRGELVCLLGPSGCGKSTLLRMVAGLIESDAGDVLIDGENVTRAAANKRPTAMVFQSHALWTHMSVARNIGFGLRVRGLPKDVIQQKVQDALALVGLEGYGGRLPTELSGGQAQRVALARCLVVEPKLLLMDEPFSALDAHLRQRLREELKLLQKRLGLTILFVTHDQEEAMEIADRVVVMNAGRFEQTGHPGELYDTPASLFVAGFIGLTNLSPVRVEAGQFAWHGVDLRVDLPDGDYTVAVRPEDLALAASGAALTIDRIINLGPHLRVLATAANGTPVKLLIDASEGNRRAFLPGGQITASPRQMRLYAGERFATELRPSILAKAAE